MLKNNQGSKGKVMWKSMILLVLTACFGKAGCLRLQHSYFSLQTVEYLDHSQSMIELNKCKGECLQMRQYFPFSFRYHRLIIRQTDGMVKYFVGHCEVLLFKNKYQDWLSLKRYVDSTNLFGQKDVVNQGQSKIWESFNEVCESKKLELSQESLKSMKLTRDHSNFYYYDDGSFENKEHFDDIGSMIAKISSLH